MVGVFALSTAVDVNRFAGEDSNSDVESVLKGVVRTLLGVAGMLLGVVDEVVMSSQCEHDVAVTIL